MEASYADIIFFAVVAGFLAMKLFTVLGKKDSDEDIQNIIKKHEQASAPSNAEIATKKAQPKLALVNNKAQPEPEVIDEVEYSNAVKLTLNEIISKDTTFTVNNFVFGAKYAFEMVIKAFSVNDKETLKNLLSTELYEKLASRVDENIRSGNKEEKSIVSIDAKEITEADLTGGQAKLRLKMLSEQINVVKDSSGVVISGSSTKIEVVEDTWEFERNIKSSSPNWVITALS